MAKKFIAGLLGVGVSMLLGCSSTKEGDADASGAGNDLPQLYWKVELVGVGLKNPATFDDGDYLRLFNDGRIVTTLSGGGHPMGVRSPTTGEWREVELPASERGGIISWYEDENNLAGYYMESPSHGFALVNGVLHKFNAGLLGLPRGWMPDSTMLVEFNNDGYLYYEKWEFGSNTAVDVLDLQDFYYEDQSKSRRFSKLSDDGTLMLVNIPNGWSSQALVKNGIEIPIGPEQFNLVEPYNATQEALLPCCRITTIDRVRGSIFGIRGGKPVIKLGDVYDQLSDEHGQPVALNGRGDAIYTSNESETFHEPRMRWNGTLYRFDLSEWSEISGYQPYSTNSGLPDVLDMNESGQVLFSMVPNGTSDIGVQLYLATPSLSPPPQKLYADLNFRIASGSGAAIDPMEVSNPSMVTGAFSENNLTLSIAAPSSEAGRSRNFFVLITNTSTTPFTLGSEIPVKATVLPTGLITGSTTYVDGPSSINLVASDGAFRVTSVDPSGGFTVVLEEIRFAGTDGTVYVLDGEVTVY